MAEFIRCDVIWRQGFSYATEAGRSIRKSYAQNKENRIENVNRRRESECDPEIPRHPMLLPYQFS